jgi:hypothetical protein
LGLRLGSGIGEVFIRCSDDVEVDTPHRTSTQQAPKLNLEARRNDNMKFSTSLVFAAAASPASAHTIFLSVNNGAVGDGVRVPSYDGVRPSSSLLYSSLPTPHVLTHLSLSTT